MKVFFRIFLSLIFFFLIYYFVPLIVSSSDKIRAIPGNTPEIFIELCFLILSLFFIALFSRLKFREFGFNYINIKEYWFSLVLVIIFYGGFLLFKVFFNTQQRTPANVSFIYILIFYVILPSISEEIFIRGFIQSLLNPLKHIFYVLHKLRISLPVLLSILYFIIIHLGTFRVGRGVVFFVFYFINITLVGFLTAYYREKTDSILPSVVIHLIVNIFNIMLPHVIGI